MPAYGLVIDVRQLARSVLVSEFPDTEIEKEQLAAQARIWTVTQKTDWDSADFQFEDIKKLETKLAAVYVLEHYHITAVMHEVLMAWKREIKDGLESIVASSTDPSIDLDVVVVASDYESYPLSLEDNPNATPYRSTDSNVI